MLDDQVIHLGGFSCFRGCSLGWYDGYVRDEDGEIRKTQPCKVCGHQMPSEMTIGFFHVLVAERDAAFERGADKFRPKIPDMRDPNKIASEAMRIAITGMLDTMTDTNRKGFFRLFPNGVNSIDETALPNVVRLCQRSVAKVTA